MKLYITKTPKVFFGLWEFNIGIEDNRSTTMPSVQKGLVIGIKQDEVLLRVNSNITTWYPLKDSRVSFFLLGEGYAPTE